MVKGRGFGQRPDLMMRCGGQQAHRPTHALGPPAGRSHAVRPPLPHTPCVWAPPSTGAGGGGRSRERPTRSRRRGAGLSLLLSVRARPRPPRPATSEPCQRRRPSTGSEWRRARRRRRRKPKQRPATTGRARLSRATTHQRARPLRRPASGRRRRGREGRRRTCVREAELVVVVCPFGEVRRKENQNPPLPHTKNGPTRGERELFWNAPLLVCPPPGDRGWLRAASAMDVGRRGAGRQWWEWRPGRAGGRRRRAPLPAQPPLGRQRRRRGPRRRPGRIPGGDQLGRW